MHPARGRISCRGNLDTEEGGKICRIEYPLWKRCMYGVLVEFEIFRPCFESLTISAEVYYSYNWPSGDESNNTVRNSNKNNRNINGGENMPTSTSDDLSPQQNQPQLPSQPQSISPPPGGHHPIKTHCSGSSTLWNSRLKCYLLSSAKFKRMVSRDDH